MPAWSGLSDGVHSTPYSLLTDLPPISGLMRRMLRKRGLFGLVKEMGGTAPATRGQVDAELPHGGARTINSENTLAEWTAGQLDSVADTRLNATYVADLSGNGSKGAIT